jgi:hypothetical protein
MDPESQSEYTVTYQIPRGVLVRVLTRRMLFRPARVRQMIWSLVAAGALYLAGGQVRILSVVPIMALLYLPCMLSRTLGKAIDQNPKFTDPATVTFGPEGVISVGPNYKTEQKWSAFNGFSEDGEYFFFSFSDSGFASMVPKSALTVEQQGALRRYAGSQIPQKS